MQEHRKKVLSIILEVIALVVLTIGTYVGTLMLFFRPPEWLMLPLYYLTIDDFSSKIPLVIICIFNAIWFASIKFWPLKNIHIKLVLSSLLIAFSAAFITMYILTNLLRGSYH